MAAPVILLGVLFVLVALIFELLILAAIMLTWSGVHAVASGIDRRLERSCARLLGPARLEASPAEPQECIGSEPTPA
jgi:hypothetical protein